MSVPDPRYQLEQILSTYEQHVMAAAQRWIVWASEFVLARLIETWPDVGDVHPYATGESKKAWRMVVESELKRVLTNEAARKGRIYVGYTEEGYTRKGPYTARSFAARGMETGEGYARKVIETYREELIDELKRRISGAAHAR